MFLTSLENVLLLLAMAIPGFIIAKAKLIKNTDNVINFLSIMLLYVCQPFVTFNAFFNTDFDLNVFKNMLVVMALTVVIMTGFPILIKLIFLKSKDPELRSTVAYSAAYGNIGYLCVPFLQMLAPGNNLVLIYATSSIVAFNVCAWTVGNYILTGERKYIKLKNALLNPAMLSFIVSLPFFILNLNFNRVGGSMAGLARVFRVFAEMVGPLAMTLLGIKFSEMKIKEVITDYRVYIASALKLVALPLVGICLLLILNLFMDISSIRLNVMAIAAMPVATNLMMFSSLSGKDVKLAAKIVLMSTLFAIVTIPLALGLAEKIF